MRNKNTFNAGLVIATSIAVAPVGLGQYSSCPPPPPPPPPTNVAPPCINIAPPAPTTAPGPGPVTTGPAGRGPITPGAGPTTPLANGPQTFGRKKRRSQETGGWEVWWHHNKEPYLLVRERSRSQTGPVGLLTGKGRATRDPVTSADASEVVVPVLERALNDGDPNVVAGTLIALCRVSGPDTAAHIAEVVAERLASPYPQVRDAAIVGLGILGDGSAVRSLWSIMNDTSDGRALLDEKSEVSERDRSLAAVAFGLAKPVGMVSMLRRAITRSSIDLAAATVVSIGLNPDAAKDPAVVQFLVELMEDSKVDRRIRAQVPVSLSRLGDHAVASLPSLLRLAGDRDVADELRRSCLIALGELAIADDVEVIRDLMKVVRKESDVSCRQFATIALGRIGARAYESGDGQTDSVAQIQSFLTRELADPSHRVDRPWSALAIGVMGFDIPLEDPSRPKLADELLDALNDVHDPSQEAAVAIALGLLGSSEAAPELLTRYREGDHGEHHHYYAESLGLVGCQDAETDLEKGLLCRCHADNPVGAATALRLLGRYSHAETLLSLLLNQPAPDAAMSYARGLERLGGRMHLNGLFSALFDASQSAAVRTAACRAIGGLGERTEMPWFASLATHDNFEIDLVALRSMLSEI